MSSKQWILVRGFSISGVHLDWRCGRVVYFNENMEIGSTDSDINSMINCAVWGAHTAHQRRPEYRIKFGERMTNNSINL